MSGVTQSVEIVLPCFRQVLEAGLLHRLKSKGIFGRVFSLTSSDK